MSSNKVTVHANVIGDTTSPNETMSIPVKEFINNRITSLNPNEKPYTVVEIITKKRVRIYHEETIDKTPTVTVSGEDIEYKGFVPYEYEEQEYCTNPPDCTILKRDIDNALANTLKSNEFINDEWDIDYHQYQPIVIMPKADIDKIYIEGDNLEELQNRLYTPAVVDKSFTIEKKKKRKCDNCSVTIDSK